MPVYPRILRTGLRLGQAAALALAPISALAESAVAEPAPDALDPALFQPFMSDFTDLFAPDRDQDWYVANFVRAQEWFRTAWSNERIRFDPEDDALVLEITATRDGNPKEFVGSQVQWNDETHFGRYEIVMQAARGDGVISSFYTYTGPWYGDPHDEIDFEFLGRDTTKVWINRFADGQNLPGQWLDLGFDSAQGANLYAFDWQPDSITWYVNGAEFFKIAAPEYAIPQTPGKIFIDIWAGAEPSWVGETPADTNTSARYYCMSYRPTGSEAPTCSMPDGGPTDG